MTAGRASPGHSTELGAPIWPPNPQTFAAPRRSRGAALEWFPSWGPDMAPKPPNVRSAPAQPWRCSGVVPVVGPRYGPQTPKRSQRPGAAVALLWSGSRRGAPIWPPNPQTFAAPRRSRGAALEWFPSWGPDMAPKPPNVRSAPAQPWRCSGVVPVVGPRYGPQTP